MGLVDEGEGYLPDVTRIEISEDLYRNQPHRVVDMEEAEWEVRVHEEALAMTNEIIQETPAPPDSEDLNDWSDDMHDLLAHRNRLQMWLSRHRGG